ncbi:hypothetical protein PACTADRAFT_34808 [Pachysolen tannophilus NRRL Y-2460]|uniref:Importin N-terminal domain-containing protein n=1 Tax=Pachysolen tannophilus NRRL Y-2460 TaxID=669874 RepID=A0A1E4TTJ1_PACTA|nr:hypothetical protein PACTADRAFT_34808 [Pachysolen tannophilus NRRL Y-2460]
MELNIQNLVDVLAKSTAPEREVYRHEAEDQLKKWEVVPGYHYLLQSIYLDTSLSLQIRWISVICFKNGVEKYWRQSRKNCVSKDEKLEIRKRLFNLIEEPNNQLTIQNAHAIAKICRFDFPVEWPSLFEDLDFFLQSSAKQKEIVGLHNLLIILNQIIKTLASVRIGRTRSALQSKSEFIMSVLVKFYVEFFQSWTKEFDVAVMEVGYICLKNLRRIIVEGFEYPHRDQSVCDFFKISLKHYQMLIIEHENNSVELLEKYIKCYSKLYSNLINSNPTAFILLPSSEEILLSNLSLLESKAEIVYNSDDENDFWEQLAIRSFLMLKKALNYTFKKGATVLKQKNDRAEIDKSLELLKTKIFKQEIVVRLFNLIMTWYLKLRPTDLESWSVEPEEWVNESLNTSWEYQVRPCAENVFQDLVLYFKDHLKNFLLNQISDRLSLANSGQSLKDILEKDSVFCAFQLSSSSISDEIDFNNLLTNLFIPAGMRNDITENRIIRRRVCLIVTEWIGMNCSRESRINIYKYLLVCLDPADKINDKVVKQTAVAALRYVIDDWDFNKTDFDPYLTKFVSLLINLVPELSLTECVLFVLRVLSVIIQQTSPLANQEVLFGVMSIVPQMWENSNNANDMILKGDLLRLLEHLTNSLNDASVGSYPISLPLITTCCDDKSEYYALLSEDGYNLWSALLKNFPEEAMTNLPDELIRDFEIIIQGLLNSTEILNVILSIIRSYALIDYRLFNNNENNKGLEIFRTLSGYLSNMRDDSLSIFVSIIEILVLENRKAQNSTLLLSNLVESGLFNAMVEYGLGDVQNPYNSVKVLLVLLRIAHFYPQQFPLMLEAINSSFQGANGETDSNRFFQYFLDECLSKYSSITEQRNKKIFFLGILSLFQPTNNDEKRGIVLAQFSSILHKLTQFLEEVNESINGDCEIYHKGYNYEDYEYFLNSENQVDGGTLHDNKMNGERKRYDSMLKNIDPVHTENLKSYTSKVLIGLKDELGGNKFEMLLSGVDASTLDQLKLLIG